MLQSLLGCGEQSTYLLQVPLSTNRWLSRKLQDRQLLRLLCRAITLDHTQARASIYKKSPSSATLNVFMKANRTETEVVATEY
jgi:hypothetical protein